MGENSQAIKSMPIFDDYNADFESRFVHTFESLNQALEWCENSLLESYYRKMERAQGTNVLWYAVAIIV